MILRQRNSYARRLLLAAMAAAYGGFLPTSCDSRVRQAVVGGTQDFIGAILTSPDTATAILEQAGATQPSGVFDIDFRIPQQPAEED